MKEAVAASYCEELRLTFFDMYHGLVVDSIADDKSSGNENNYEPSTVNENDDAKKTTPPQATSSSGPSTASMTAQSHRDAPKEHPWDAFDSSPVSYRRKAAVETVKYLVERIRPCLSRNSIMRKAKLPFLYEEHLIEMIRQSQASVRDIAAWRLRRDCRKPSNTRRDTIDDTAFDFDTKDQIPPQTGASLCRVPIPTTAAVAAAAVAAADETDEEKRLKYQLDVEHHHRAEKTRVWGALMMHENRRLRELWLADTERSHRAALSRGQSDKITEAYNWVKRQNKVSLREKLKKAGLDGALERATELEGIRCGIIEQEAPLLANLPPEGPATFAQMYDQTLTDPYFLPIARRHMDEWCASQSASSKDGSEVLQLLKMVKAAQQLPDHAWLSAVPPVWSDKKGVWIWDKVTRERRSKEGTKRAEPLVPAQIKKEREVVDDESKPSDRTSSADFPALASLTKYLSNGKDPTKPRVDAESPSHTPEGINKQQGRRDAAADLDQDDQESEQKRGAIESQVETEHGLFKAAQEAAIDDTSEKSDGTYSAARSHNTELVWDTDGRPYRTQVALRFDFRRAVQYARKGQLRTALCPLLQAGNASRLLEVCRRFRKDLSVRNSGKDPFAATRFMMKKSLRPSDLMKMMELEDFLKLTRKFECLELDREYVEEDDDENYEEQRQEHATPTIGLCEPGETLCECCKAEDRAADAARSSGSEVIAANVPAAKPVTVTTPLLQFDLVGPVDYPLPPESLDLQNMIPWAHSLTAAQLASLRTKQHRTWALRALLIAARRFVLRAALHLTPGMFERLVSPSSKSLLAIDLPTAKYMLGRTVIFTQILRREYVRFERHNAARRDRSTGHNDEFGHGATTGRNAGHEPVPDYAVQTLTRLNAKYETLPQIVAVGRKFVDNMNDAALWSAAADVAVAKLGGWNELAEAEIRERRREISRHKVDKSHAKADHGTQKQRHKAQKIGRQNSVDSHNDSSDDEGRSRLGHSDQGVKSERRRRRHQRKKSAARSPPKNHHHTSPLPESHPSCLYRPPPPRQLQARHTTQPLASNLSTPTAVPPRHENSQKKPQPQPGHAADPSPFSLRLSNMLFDSAAKFVETMDSQADKQAELVKDFLNHWPSVSEKILE